MKQAIVYTLLIVAMSSCTKKQFNPAGSYKSLMDTGLKMTISKKDNNLFVATSSNSELRSLEFASQCSDAKLAAFYRTYAYSNTAECKKFEKSAEKQGRGSIIIGDGGEWISIYPIEDSAAIKRLIDFPGDDKMELEQLPDYDKPHLLWITMTGKKWLLEKEE